MLSPPCLAFPTSQPMPLLSLNKWILPIQDSVKILLLHNQSFLDYQRLQQYILAHLNAHSILAEVLLNTQNPGITVISYHISSFVQFIYCNFCTYLIIQFSSVHKESCLTLCDPMNHSMLGTPVHYQLPESTQTHVHWVGDAIQLSHPLLSPSPPALNLSQHQGLFRWVSSSHQEAKVLEFQLQHQSFQWTLRTDLL